MPEYFVFSKGAEAVLEAFKRAAQGINDILIVKPIPGECPEDQVKGKDVDFVILDEISETCNYSGLRDGHWIAVVEQEFHDGMCDMYAGCDGNVGTITRHPSQTPDEFAEEIVKGK